jgi:hypothetical protein
MEHPGELLVPVPSRIPCFCVRSDHAAAIERSLPTSHIAVGFWPRPREPLVMSFALIAAEVPIVRKLRGAGRPRRAYGVQVQPRSRELVGGCHDAGIALITLP